MSEGERSRSEAIRRWSKWGYEGEPDDECQLYRSHP